MMLRSMAERGTFHAFHESRQGNETQNAIGELPLSARVFLWIFLGRFFQGGVKIGKPVQKERAWCLLLLCGFGNEIR